MHWQTLQQACFVLSIEVHGMSLSSIKGKLSGKQITLPMDMSETSLIARFMGSTWGPSGADRTQVGPMLAP